MTEPKAPDYADNVTADEKRRLIDQHIAAKSSERYSIHAAQLAGDTSQDERAKELDETLARLHGERSAIK